MKLPHPIAYGEFFSGPGGMSLGITRGIEPIVEIEHKFAVDLDPDSVATYNRNIAPVAIEADVRNVVIENLPSVDLFTFGFPCNDFSVVGEQLGLGGNYGPLYTFGARYLDHHQPLAFIAENVSGLSSANEGKALKEILTRLSASGQGYDLFPHLYNAADYGVPQSRKRILIVGVRKDLNAIFRVPAPTTCTPRTVKDALIDNPIPKDALNHELTRQSAIVIERLKYIRPGQNAFTADLPPHLRLNVEGAKISQIYRRLDPDKPSYTVTGSGGGGTHVYHWEENRALTNRERARLQSFPDSFVFSGSKESVRKQIGMAVPPQLISEVAKALILSLQGQDYPWVEPNLDYLTGAKSTNQSSFVFAKKNDYIALH